MLTRGIGQDRFDACWPQFFEALFAADTGPPAVSLSSHSLLAFRDVRAVPPRCCAERVATTPLSVGDSSITLASLSSGMVWLPIGCFLSGAKKIASVRCDQLIY
ncbi:hypothetical protein CVM52_04165 [Pseudooceanicola lipolyticus]|uniref:Uncharacterized protein n=1 Tax=Pseudooceanicola lipolyticus TaxID=2029104 RepID=A0A2M8J5C1_9RHOB|nr:hypothetical protein CVM52_04165 [Pseudooceanicola lipolyticus]